MATNCNKFHLIRDTTTCQGIVDYNRITMADFRRWNTGISASCNNLWLGSYACVGVIGHMVYVGSLWYFDHTGHEGYPILAGVVIGVREPGPVFCM